MAAPVAALAATGPMGWAALGVGGIFMGASMIGQNRSAKKVAKAYNRMADAQIEQTQLMKRMADIDNVRKQRDMIRRARVARAGIINAGANTNTQNSSGVAGGAGSVLSQMSGELDYFRQTGKLQNQIFGTQMAQASQQAKIGGYQADAAMYGALGSIGSQMFAAGGGWETIFGTRK